MKKVLISPQFVARETFLILGYIIFGLICKFEGSLFNYFNEKSESFLFSIWVCISTLSAESEYICLKQRQHTDDHSM